MENFLQKVFHSRIRFFAKCFRRHTESMGEGTVKVGKVAEAALRSDFGAGEGGRFYWFSNNIGINAFYQTGSADPDPDAVP